MTKIYSVNSMPIKAVGASLAAGQMILYPTDTIYALGVDPSNPATMAKLFASKGRDENKPVSCIFSDWEQVEKYAERSELASRLATYLPGQLTLVLKGKGDLPSVGVRIPDNEFCRRLAGSYGPVTATSANLSGRAELSDLSEIINQVPNIDLAVDAGALSGTASTVIDARGKEPIILRQGAWQLPSEADF